MTFTSTQALDDFLNAHREVRDPLYVQCVEVISEWIKGDTSDRFYCHDSMKVVAGRFIDFLSALPGANLLISRISRLAFCQEDSYGR